MDYETGQRIKTVVEEVATRVAERFAQQAGNLLGDYDYNMLVFRTAVVESEIALVRAGYNPETRRSFYPGEVISDVMNEQGYEQVNAVYAEADKHDTMFGETGLTI